MIFGELSEDVFSSSNTSGDDDTHSLSANAWVISSSIISGDVSFDVGVNGSFDVVNSRKMLLANDYFYINYITRCR